MKAKTLRLVFEKSVFPIMMMIFMGKPAMVMMGKPKKTDTTFLTNQFVCNVKIHIQDLVRCVGEGVSPLHKNFYARQYESFIYWQNWYEISIRNYCLVASSSPSRVWGGLELGAAPSRCSPGFRIQDYFDREKIICPQKLHHFYFNIITRQEGWVYVCAHLKGRIL